MPSMRDLQAHFGYRSPQGAFCHVVALVRKGWLGDRPVSRSRSFILRRRPDGSPFTGFVEP
jgi:hypothetical protein